MSFNMIVYMYLSNNKVLLYTLRKITRNKYMVGIRRIPSITSMINMYNIFEGITIGSL